MFMTRLIQRLHRDERGAVSLETILIIGAIALPIMNSHRRGPRNNEAAR